MTEPLLEVERLVKSFHVSGAGSRGGRQRELRAVDGVSFRLEPGQTLGVVGESGCGKSTLARCVLRLLDIDDGRIRFEGTDITKLGRSQMVPHRRRMAMVFQDPYASLNPRLRIGSIIAEPIRVHERETAASTRRRVEDLLDRVGLNPDHYNRFPHQFSGGQRQRIGIARALALRPRLVVCDEPVSALDVSVQAQILNLLADLQAEFQLTYLFIAHDLEVVRHVCDRVSVMYLGQIIEEAASADFYAHPRHPYSAALLSAVPVPDPSVARDRRPVVLRGEVPSPLTPPAACRFHPRCPRCQDVCTSVAPVLSELARGHRAACHFPVERWPLERPEELAEIGTPDAA